MPARRHSVQSFGRNHALLAGAILAAFSLAAADNPKRHPLDPRGQVHIPIGVANTVDALKTFVEAEGSFSPGFGSHGIYFWVWDAQARKLHAPTLEGVKCEHGLGADGALIPWSKWSAGPVEVRTEVCEVRRRVATGPTLVDKAVPFRLRPPMFLVGARAHLTNRGAGTAKLTLYAALRPLGPAGGPVKVITANGDCLLVESNIVLQAGPVELGGLPPARGGVLATDTIAEWAMRGELPPQRHAVSENGQASGALAFDLELRPGDSRTISFICPVLPGRRVIGHRWDGVSAWAQFDLNRPNPAEDGSLQPVVEPADLRLLKAADLFAEAGAYWRRLQGRASLRLPDARWSESFAAIVGHAAMCLNEGAPDVAVVNYNVFNRDGMYVANIFQKSGNFDLAALAIDYFLKRPFNGRVQPEADNPGQILWILGEHWRFTRDRPWLRRVYPAARQLAAMIRYYRTAPGPHWVSDTSLDFGEPLPAQLRKELKPGACDGFNPAYTEAYDIAGLRAAIVLAAANGQIDDTAAWNRLANELFAVYERKFGGDLPRGYGSYSVLWPCRLYPFGEGRAWEQFRILGAQRPADWRYFPLARAHQGLLAGNRAAAWETLEVHLAHPQMRGWYAFDEGGPSGVGGWHHVLTAWPITRNVDGTPKSTIAMPHGWAIAEFHLLLRDALLFEDGERLVLLAGVPPAWFRHPDGMRVDNLPTHFGACSFEYRLTAGGAVLSLDSPAPHGSVLCLPPELKAKATADGRELPPLLSGMLRLPPGTKTVRLTFEK